MTTRFEPATFIPHLHETFEAEVEGIVVPLELVEVTDTTVRGPVHSFSIFFRGPVDAQLTQGNFTLGHPGVGVMTLFLVPIAESNAERIVYQASFSRLESAS